MSWRVFLQTLNLSLPGSSDLDDSLVQFVLGETTFILEYDERDGSLLAVAILTPVANADQLDAAQLLHFLKINMRLQSLGLGAIACDMLEGEMVWRREWLLERTSGEEVLEALQQIDAMRSGMIAEGWIRYPAGTGKAAAAAAVAANEGGLSGIERMDRWLNA